jgi:(p)ppGpp synthase/HD superfamily hydrolase
MSNVKEAAKFAIKAHGSQRYGGKPYSYHLEKVYKNVVRFGGSDVHQTAAWLHDVIEDTGVTKGDVAKTFGSSVARIVDLVSNQGSKEATYKRIRTDKDAVFVKLCDRLANVTEGGKRDMYRKQYQLFSNILYKRGEFDALWKAIEKTLGI